MAKILCAGQSVELLENETVLDGLLRAGLSVSHSCRAGACQSCLVRATAGAPPAEAQMGLQDGLKAQGYFLACSARPKADLQLRLPTEAEASVAARICDVSPLGPNTVKVRIEPQAPFPYRAGQFVNVVRRDGLARSYSLASLPEDGALLELHVRVLPGGRMSTWLGSAACEGAAVSLRGPSGSCFYTEGRPAQPLLLVGTGTGLAPLFGVVRSALLAGHTGPIHLFHGARTPRGLYLREELQALASRHHNLRYLPCALEGLGEPDVRVGAIDELVISLTAGLAQHRVFLCGDPGIVATLRKKVFLAGASMKEIYSDPFIAAPPPAGVVAA